MGNLTGERIGKMLDTLESISRFRGNWFSVSNIAKITEQSDVTIRDHLSRLVERGWLESAMRVIPDCKKPIVMFRHIPHYPTQDAQQRENQRLRKQVAQLEDQVAVLTQMLYEENHA